jgi:hypothetical protein
MRRGLQRVVTVVGLMSLPVVVAQSQPSPSAAAAFARARQLVVNGQAAAGRLLVDSVLAATPADSADYPEALYWHATLAASPADAERDYRRIIVEHGFSARAGDALIQLAQLEVARNDRDAAETHLRRFLLEQPSHGQRGRAGYLLARLHFDRNELARGCAALTRTRGDVSPDSIELRNQVEYLAPRCDGVDTSGAVATAVDTTAKANASVTPRRDTTVTESRPGRGRFTVQVASYQTRDAALALAKRLGAEARVVGKVKPFRVHLGRYETRAAATAAVRRLNARGFKQPFVTEAVDDQ